MSDEALGVVLGLLASFSLESGYLLMTAQSRKLERPHHPGMSFLGHLLHRPLWLLAMGLDGVGIGFQLFALRHASLIVVQPLMSVGLIGLVFAAPVFLGERITRGTVLDAVALGAGVVLVIAAAPSEASAVRLSHPVWSVVILGALGAVAVGPFLLRRETTSWRLVAAAGAGDTLVAISGNQIARSWIQQPFVAIAWLVAVAASGISSVTAESAALQRLPASRVGPIVASVGAVLPVVVMTLLSPRRFSPGPGSALMLSVGLILVGGGAYRLALTTRAGALVPKP
jgi:drug/metabolite transporter (DMT)-like permease